MSNPEPQDYTAPGQLYEVGGAKLHLWRKGTGSPAVVISTGGGVTALRWAPLVDAIAEFTTAVVYDRPGYGWSEARAGARTLDAVSEELEELLSAARIVPPYVLVGHSLGGPYIRQFARRNPDQVGGLVLVDSSHEEQATRLDVPERVMKLQKRMSWVVTQPWARPVVRALIKRQVRKLMPTLPPSLKGREGVVLQQELSAAKMKAGTAEAAEMEGFAPSLKIPIPPVPMVVLVAGKPISVPGLRSDDAQALHERWLGMQRELTALSPQAEMRIVDDSGHMIPDERPDVVVAAVRELVDRARSGVPARTA